MLEFLLQAVDDVTMDQKTAITEAINAIVEKRVAGEKVGFKHVLKVLRDSTSSENCFGWSLSDFNCHKLYLGTSLFRWNHSRT